MKDLDRRLAALGRVEVDRNLGDLEGAVWARIDARARLRPMPAYMATMVCSSAALVISAVGAATAAAAAPTRPDASVFAIHSSFAPSTALAD